MKTDNPSSITGEPYGFVPKSEGDHFSLCEVCGQAFDMRSWDQVMYHSKPEHKPARLDA